MRYSVDINELYPLLSQEATTAPVRLELRGYLSAKLSKPRTQAQQLKELSMTSPMNDAAFQQEEELNWEEAPDWLFGELELCECDPPENEWQVGYEAALRDMFSQLIGRPQRHTLH